jgi:hypothetical protein
MDDLIEPVAAAATTRRKKAVGAADSVGDLRPITLHITHYAVRQGAGDRRSPA